MKTLFILYLILPNGKEIPWRESTNIHACAGQAALERLAQTWVQMKTGVDLNYKFICKGV